MRAMLWVVDKLHAEAVLSFSATVSTSGVGTWQLLSRCGQLHCVPHQTAPEGHYRTSVCMGRWSVFLSLSTGDGEGDGNT